MFGSIYELYEGNISAPNGGKQILNPKCILDISKHGTFFFYKCMVDVAKLHAGQSDENYTRLLNNHVRNTKLREKKTHKQLLVPSKCANL